MHFNSLYFDLDDTLYPAHSGLWEAIRERMNDYMQRLVPLPPEQVAALRQSYLERYGTTLRGLQMNYAVDADDYLAYVHDLPLREYIRPDPALRTLLQSLPQRKWIFTNADDRHTARVMTILGIEGCFDGIIDIRLLGFTCKPDQEAYRKALAITGDQASQVAILDDAPRNLAPAHELGFFTVLVGQDGHDLAIDRSMRSIHDLPKTLPELWEPPS